MNSHHYLVSLVVAVLVWSVPLGAQAQETPPKPALKGKKITTPIQKAFELDRPPSASGQESGSAPAPSGVPPIGGPRPVDKIPDQRIGDLACGQPIPGDANWTKCENACKTRSQTPCVLHCVFRKNDDGQCVLYVECTSLCSEIPDDQTPTGR